MTFADNQIHSYAMGAEIIDEGNRLKGDNKLSEPKKDYVITEEHLTSVVTLLNNVDNDVCRVMALSLSCIPELDEYYTKDEVASE